MSLSFKVIVFHNFVCRGLRRLFIDPPKIHYSISAMAGGIKQLLEGAMPRWIV
jgi:hypothetical protein